MYFEKNDTVTRRFRLLTAHFSDGATVASLPTGSRVLGRPVSFPKRRVNQWAERVRLTEVSYFGRHQGRPQTTTYS